MGVANTWILESSAIATMFLLDLEDLLQILLANLLVSQATGAELDDMIREDALFRGGGGVLTKQNGRVVFTPITPAEKEERRQLLLRRINKVKAACKVVGCIEFASLNPQRRDIMIKALGQGGAESIVLASKPGHLLWTDDARLGGFARTEYGAKSVWTQAVLQWAAGKGHISEEKLALSTAQLIGFGYSFTSPSLPALVEAAKIAEWNPGRWPLSSALDQLGSETIHLRGAAILGAAFIEQTYRQAILDEPRRQIVTSILDKLADRPGGIRAIEGIQAFVPTIFGLNVIGATDVFTIIQTWFKARTIQLARSIG